MHYYSGFVTPVPTARREDYRAHAARAWPHFARRGALRMVEGWGEDVPHGTHTDFYRATQAREDETIVFSWIAWPDRATADAAWAAIMADEAMAAEMGDMPFDGRRMFWGAFDELVAGGEQGGGWMQGFMLPVPAANKEAYRTMAVEAWETAFRPNGCTGLFETWGADVPHGKETDFYRGTDAQPSEEIVFAWTWFPDRATCDAATAQMNADMLGREMPQMPFDGRRMVWGGFVPLFDSATA